GAGRTRHFRTDDGGGKSRARRLSAERQGGIRAPPRAGAGAVSSPEGAPRANGRLALRRRAADARGRPRADVRTETAAARRALAGARAPRRRGNSRKAG